MKCYVQNVNKISDDGESNSSDSTCYDIEPNTIVKQNFAKTILSPKVDTIITDPPYSQKTHVGHGKTKEIRKDIQYNFFTEEDVEEAAKLFCNTARGWIVVMTDHVLAPTWIQSFEEFGHYVFAPIVFLEPGSRVRFQGDGPANWNCWIVVARPRCKPFSKWGSLPGGYCLPKGLSQRERKKFVVGCKPLWIMKQLVSDYTRHGDTVLDPCAGAGTTIVAAKELGRIGYGMDIDQTHVDIANQRAGEAVNINLFCENLKQQKQDVFGFWK